MSGCPKFLSLPEIWVYKIPWKNSFDWKSTVHASTTLIFIFSHQTYYFRDWFRVELKPRIFSTHNTSLIGSRLIDFSLYWNWCRWFSVLLLCKSNSYVLEMMNDEVLGMECTSLFLLFFRENENSRKYAHALFLDICHHTNNITYMHNTFWHLHIWIFQTETFLVILRKRWTSSNILLYVSFFYSY